MGIDQHGEHYHGLEHPKKDLMERLGASRADKLYRDKADGRTVHVGYVIGGAWIILFTVEPFEKETGFATIINTEQNSNAVL